MTDTVVLILTDNLPHAQRVASGLASLNRRMLLRDVADAEQDLDADRAIVVSDISFAKPASITGARALLSRFASKVTDHVCLIRREDMRDRIQANALGADDVVCIAQGLGGLRRVLAARLPKAPRQDQAPEHVGAVREVLREMIVFGRTGRPIPPPIVASGAELVVAALRDVSIRDWMDEVSRFDDRTHKHCLLVAALAAAFGMHLGFSDADARRLARGGLLHDIGKSRIPIELLNKPARLEEHERVIVKTHAALGWEMLQGHGYDAECMTIVRSHHELLDGSGYPDGLKGSEIPDIVRMMTICDIFGALIEHRPYKHPTAPAVAFGILEDMAAVNQLDVALVRAFRPVALACEPMALAS